MFRRLHKKGAAEESAKKRVRKTAKAVRPVVGASLDMLKAKRDMTPAARLAERKKVVDAVKEQKKASQDKKKAEAAKVHPHALAHSRCTRVFFNRRTGSRDALVLFPRVFFN